MAFEEQTGLLDGPFTEVARTQTRAMPPAFNRRQFLRSRRLAEAAGFALDVLDSEEMPPRRGLPQAAGLLSVARRAMACLFEILVPAETSNALDAATAALDAIDRLEDQLTVYRDTSEVSRLNALAAHAPVPVEEGLFDLLALAARLTEETEGAFDITAGALIKCWGFFKGPRRVPPADELESARQHVGMRHVVLDSKKRSIRLLRPGLEINLGSIGKGYAIDRIARLLKDAWRILSALLHGGFSSVYALGTPPHDPRGWSVGVCDPRNPNYRLGAIRLKDRALGTSAATFQHLEHQGRRLGHILDPRTGWPAEGMLSASVAAPNAAEADALTTAFFIHGVEWAKVYCEKHPEVGAMLVPQPPPGERAVPVLLGRIDGEIYPEPQPIQRVVEYDETE